MADIVIDVRAYCKMLLHVMKYPHRATNGIFLAEKKKNKDNGMVNIVDCIPLFHLTLGLTPMLEIAMMQIDHYCKNNGLVIAGYYQANENFRDSSPDFIAYRIADRINDHFEDSCLVMVDNQKLSLDCDDLAFVLYQCHDNKWKPKDKTNVHLEQGIKALGIASALLHSKTYRQLSDFDNHLDDVKQDWSNQEVNEKIANCL